MPKTFSEVTSGTQFQRSMQDGTIADSQDRVFKIILNAPNEVVDPQQVCQVYVGDAHPINQNIYCKSFSVRFDGESRLVMVVTFSYESTAHSSQQPQEDKPPELRAANWTTSTSLIEQPLYRWRKRTGHLAWGGDEPAVNPAGDIYDAVTQLTSIVNITIEQPEVVDPTQHNLYGGYINDEEMRLGSLVMPPHTVMFRGVSSQPHVESWRETFFRGWKSTYEFAFKRNRTKVYFVGYFVGGGEMEVDLGWDIAVPQSGFNVKAFVGGGAEDEMFGQPLQHTNARIVPPLLPAGDAGDKVRAMVKVFSYEDGGVSQAPSASPVPLNDSGRPRKDTADPKVLVYGYQVQPSTNLTQALQLRLQ